MRVVARALLFRASSRLAIQSPASFPGQFCMRLAIYRESIVKSRRSDPAKSLQILSIRKRPIPGNQVDPIGRNRATVSLQRQEGSPSETNSHRSLFLPKIRRSGSLRTWTSVRSPLYSRWRFPEVYAGQDKLPALQVHSHYH